MMLTLQNIISIGDDIARKFPGLFSRQFVDKEEAIVGMVVLYNEDVLQIVEAISIQDGTVFASIVDLSVVLSGRTDWPRSWNLDVWWNGHFGCFLYYDFFFLKVFF